MTLTTLEMKGTGKSGWILKLHYFHCWLRLVLHAVCELEAVFRVTT